MDRRAYRYLKDKRSVWLAAIVLALGLILIFIGSRENDGTSGGGGEEERLAEICSGIAGVGECRVILYYSPADGKDDGRIESVIVVCEGADSMDVRLRLTEMLASFFGIGTNRIKIEKKR